MISKKNTPLKCSLTINEESVKYVQKFSYLGSLVTSDGKCTNEIRKRIALLKNIFNLRSAFKNRQPKLKTKIRMLECYVWSVLLFGCDAWTINESMKNRIEAAEIWFLRRMLRISRIDKVSIEEILRKAGVKRSLMKVIRKRQMQVSGACNEIWRNGESDANREDEEKRSRGRQRLKFIIILNIEILNRSDLEMLILTKDRKR